MATRHSNRTRPSRRVHHKPKTPAGPAILPPTKAAAGSKPPARSGARADSTKTKMAKPSDLSTIRDHFYGSLALVETAYAVLNVAQDDWDVGCCSTDISSAVLTLQLGLQKLQRLHEDLDIAILTRRRE